MWGNKILGKNIVFIFIIKINSLMSFGPHVVGLFLCEDFLACVETWD
jgi:hypothetical protein